MLNEEIMLLQAEENLRLINEHERELLRELNAMIEKIRNEDCVSVFSSISGQYGCLIFEEVHWLEANNYDDALQEAKLKSKALT